MNNWIDIKKEDWPIDREILLCSIDSVFYRNDKLFFQISGISRPIGDIDFTHWMPLPKPPKGEPK